MMNPYTVDFFLNGEAVSAREGESIWQVAKRLGTSIPHLCHSEQKGYRSDGNCRACMVEVEGEHGLAASCVRMPSKGMASGLRLWGTLVTWCPETRSNMNPRAMCALHV